MNKHRNDIKAGSQLTGRYIVLFKEGAGDAARAELSTRVGMRAFGLEDYERGARATPEASLMLDELGVAVVDVPPERRGSMLAAVDDPASPIEAVDFERRVYAIADLQRIEAPTNGRARTKIESPDLTPFMPAPPQPQLPVREPAAENEFLRGYRAAFQDLVGQLLAEHVGMREPVAPAISPALLPLLAAEETETWGLVATRAAASRFSGRGIKLAVLDTGFDLQHPDFAGRNISHASFISGEDVQDRNGHGTHCIGTACGPLRPPGAERRYGVAYDAEIFAGKVLSNEGNGSDEGILAGIAWAVKNGCSIISMSLGSSTELGESYSEVYESVARRAARRGTIIVAAAGNESARPADIRPVGHPANAPSIVAVAAIDRLLGVASFSCGGLNGAGGEVNITGPGVDVFSSWPMPRRYRSISGTSMATPHVAGILALAAEATGLRGFELVNQVLRRSRSLSSVRDFGWGLVQAP